MRTLLPFSPTCDMRALPWWPALPLLSMSMSHAPRRPFTPSMPSPSFGHPNPRAIVGGNASGMLAAEKNEMDSVWKPGSFSGGRRIWVASSAFSGIDKNDGMLYLLDTLRLLFAYGRVCSGARTSPAFARECFCIAM